MAGGERDLAAAVGCAAPFAIGDAADGAGGFLDSEGALAQFRGFGLARIGKVQCGQGATQQPVFRREARIGIFRRLPRHGDGTIDQCAQGRGIHVRRGDAGGALADEDTQADFFALRSLHILQRAKAHRDRGRGIAGVDGVGRVSPGPACRRHQILRAGLGFFEAEHGCGAFLLKGEASGHGPYALGPG